ncbi:metal-dependent hydrolase [Desulfovibrio sp. OttesenSCG-928-I05]|nr:metal-dependent hydrolase [Desulfovibrio sp. OttesenSCG-928-I05]
MDTLTHLVAGAMTPLAFRNAPKSRLLIPFGILCGEFPDIDVLAGASAEAFLSFHRGITHALVVQPFSALLLALLFHRLLRRKDTAGSWTFGKTWLVAFLALLIHLYLDCMTTFGTQIFLPFSDYRVAVPGMFIVDLLLTLPILGLFITVLLRGGAKTLPYRRQPLARATLVWVLVYPLLSFSVGQAAASVLGKQYAAEKNEADIRRVYLTPEPFAPVNWKFVAEKGGDLYVMAPYSLLHPGDVSVFQDFKRVDPALWADLQGKIPLAAMYADFVSFPVEEYRAPSANEPDCERILVVHDLRYEQFWKKTLEFVGRSDRMFIFEVCLDAADSPVAWRFMRRENDRAHADWSYPGGA